MKVDAAGESSNTSFVFPDAGSGVPGVSSVQVICSSGPWFMPCVPLLLRKVVKPRQVLPGLSRLMMCSVSGNAVYGRGSVVTIPTQDTLGLLQGAAGSGMRHLQLPQKGPWRGNPLWSPFVSQQL